MDEPNELPRLLLVDDDALILRALGRQLARRFTLRTALGAESAIRALEESSDIDALVFDMQMPPVDGPMLFARVMARWPHLRARSAVATGAPDADDVVEFAHREGIILFDKNGLAAQIQAWVSRR